MGVFKNGVGRPSNETIKKRNIFKVICVLLVLIIIFLVGYILNDKGIISINNNENTKKVENNNKKISETKEISNKDAEKVMEDVLSADWSLYTKYAGIDIFNKNLYKSLVAVNKTQKSSKNYDICSLYTCDSDHQAYNGSMDYKSYLGVFDSAYGYADVSATFNKLFKTGKLQKDIFTEEFFWERIIYNANENAYFKFTPTSGDGPNYIISEVYDAYEKENILHITIVYETGECDEDNNCYINVDNKRINLEENYEDIVEKYGETMSKYDFSFEKTNDGYKFIKSSKLK